MHRSNRNLSDGDRPDDDGPDDDRLTDPIDQTVDALQQSDLGDNTSIEDRQTNRLGVALRESVDKSLPSPSDDLRSLLDERLQSDDAVMTRPIGSRKRIWASAAIAVAAALLGLMTLPLLLPKTPLAMESVRSTTEDVALEVSQQAATDADLDLMVEKESAEETLVESQEIPVQKSKEQTAEPVPAMVAKNQKLAESQRTKVSPERFKRPLPVIRSREETRYRVLQRDGKSVRESYQVTVPYTEYVEQAYTVNVPLSQENNARDFFAETRKSHAENVAGNRTNRAAARFSIPAFNDEPLQLSESYEALPEREFVSTQGEAALSTFSIDVDTASYSNARRFLMSGRLPPPNSIRVEEFLNYFKYDDPSPQGDKPFAVKMEIADCPWNSATKLLRIGVKGKEIKRQDRPASNLVFLIDVSGSMRHANKLELVKRGLKMMTNHLREDDFVSIVTYAGSAGVALQPTSGDQTKKINEVIDALESGGSTNGGAGIDRAYELAAQHFMKDGTNRVLLATDGDLNVGITDDGALTKLIQAKAGEGVFLTVLGFGTGNLKDSKMENLADNGNGVYAYIDSFREARNVLVEQMSGSLVTIAKDVKLQLEFNPAKVASYRLIGYENRALANMDFDDDKKDAGELGAGHCVTALYELVEAGNANPKPKIPTEMKYQDISQATPSKPDASATGIGDTLRDKYASQWLTLALRYKQPDADKSQRIEFVFEDSATRFPDASEDFRFASSVAAFGMLLRQSKYAGEATMTWCEQTASGSLGDDDQGYRSEFVDLVRKAASLQN